MTYHVCPGVVITDVWNVHLMVATGDARGRVPYVKSINDTGVWFWEQFELQLTPEQIINAAMAQYQITHEQAQSAYQDFFEALRSDGYLIVTESNSEST